MKRMIKMLAAAVIALSAAGCSDAVASLKEKNDKVITIGNHTVTKGDLYANLRDTYGGDVAIDKAKRRIASQEVETTDEIKNKAQEYVDSMKKYYGDDFESVMAESGGSEEEMLNTYIETLKVEKLTSTYIEDNFDLVCEKYKPVKAIVLTFTDLNNAAYCQRALSTKVLTVEEAAKEYGAGSSSQAQFFTIDSTTYDAEARSIIMSNTPEDDWALTSSLDGNTHYVIHVESNTPSEFKDDVVQQMTINGSVEEDCTKYYFANHNFHVYDKFIFDQIQENASYALVQVPAPAEETAEPAPTEAAGN
ncbi:MAG: hypothetical protein IJ120_11685 [Solobacterium sp.]|nr:hypothetical protein [Solobacterium sp.]